MGIDGKTLLSVSKTFDLGRCRNHWSIGCWAYFFRKNERNKGRLIEINSHRYSLKKGSLLYFCDIFHKFTELYQSDDSVKYFDGENSQQKKVPQFPLNLKEISRNTGLEKARSYELILHWLNNRLSRNQFLVLSGILVAAIAGLAGVILKTLVHNIHYFITNKVHFEYQILFYIVFPF